MMIVSASPIAIVSTRASFLIFIGLYVGKKMTGLFFLFTTGLIDTQASRWTTWDKPFPSSAISKRFHNRRG
jgi:hypothetical protein